MGIWQGRSKRKRTGGRLRPIRKKRRNEIARELQTATVGVGTVKKYRVRGGNRKLRILTAQTINVYDPATKGTRPAKIVTVRENPANPNYVQRNIVTKGAILETEVGLVRVRSRPGQDGVLNGVRIAGAAPAAA
ncbi:MAG: 30S ribosomal protein S8e [Thermoplasmatales archaeon]|jgi:small subunit ribosomal protein S8e|nr:30S ribosomal protein S8e [Candidatus Thermoplasmatota archaeon]MCL5983673.1 30S ribosomal protein S8e [Candidatus Thermoplasmatota archaeon]MCW6167129.1 30S ribosomal protein S8e [Thermoplasmatales archaeon]